MSDHQNPASPGNTPSLPPQPTAGPPQKKGMSTGAKVGIGCGAAALVCTVIAAIGIWYLVVKVKSIIDNPEKAAAEFIIERHPDLEAAKFNDEDKTVTVLYKKDGKEYTIDYSQIAEGRIELKDSEGNVITLGSNDISKIPDWVPQPEQASKYYVLYIESNNQVQKGQYTAELTSAGTELLDSLDSQLKADGYTVTRSHVTAEGAGQWHLTAKKDTQEIVILMVTGEDKNRLMVSWQEK